MNRQMDLEIEAEEARLTQATRDLDVDTLDRIYANDIMFTGVNGQVCNKASVMAEARRGVADRKAVPPGAPTVASYEKDDLAIVRHGQAAVAAFRFAVTIRHDGTETVRRFRATNVWVQRDGTWQVIAAQTGAIELG